MFSQTTRLEFIIVTVALLVLLMCSQPPRSGNANVQMPPSEPAAGVRSDNPAVPQNSLSETADSVSGRLTETSAPASDIPAVRPSDQSSFIEQAPARMTPAGSTAAQNTTAANNEEATSEEVAVRYVWDGTKLAPQKVRIVDEGNGVRSIYSFDQ